MSDWYDSLEDESVEKNNSSDSLNENETNVLGFLKGANEDKSSGRSDLFYLSKKVIGKKLNFVPNFQCNEAEHLKKNFLPKIETAAKGWNATPNAFLDNQILKQQGLQINSDGSFTKSPRPMADELPFITREYRNLQFQKKKTYKMKKAPRPRIQKKDFFSLSKNLDDGIPRNKKMSARHDKGSCEEILTSAGSLSSRLWRQLKLDKQLLANDNLTDSMKEKLLQSNRDKRQERLQVIGSLKKTKRVMNLLESPKISQNTFSKQQRRSPRKTSIERSPDERLVSNQKKKRTYRPVISEQHSEVTLNSRKPSLSYSERLQLKSGFNPLYLRLGNKKVLSDTNRSNFGDSVTERLSEVSSRVFSSENLRDEDEESFYRTLMEKDKSDKLIRRNSRSEGPIEFAKLRSSAAEGFSKKHTEVKQNNLRVKPVSKSMPIDLPSETDNIIQSIKKNPHYCLAVSSPKMSKFELALKAKTYGYLANARNIFKMKAQTEGKSPAKGDKNSKVGEKNFISAKNPTSSCSLSKNFPSKSILPEVQDRFSGAFEKFPKAKKAPRKGTNCETPEEDPPGLALPRVTGAENKDTKIQTEILNRMSKCLNGRTGETPNGRIETVSRGHLNKAVHCFLKTV